LDWLGTLDCLPMVVLTLQVVWRNLPCAFVAFWCLSPVLLPLPTISLYYTSTLDSSACIPILNYIVFYSVYLCTFYRAVRTALPATAAVRCTHSSWPAFAPLLLLQVLLVLRCLPGFKMPTQLQIALPFLLRRFFTRHLAAGTARAARIAVLPAACLVFTPFLRSFFSCGSTATL